MAGNQGAIDDVVRESALKQLDDLTAKATAAEAQIVSLTKAATELNAATGNSRSFREYNNNAARAATETAKLQKAQQDLARATVLLQQAEQRLAALTNQTAISQQNLERATLRNQQAQDKAAASAQKALSPYQQLVAVYRNLQAEAQNYGVTLGTQSQQFIEASRQANEVRARLDGIDNSLGNFQRNVGNYSSATTGFFSKFYSGIAKIANIVPGLGIGGAFLLIGEGIKYAFDQLTGFNKKVQEYIATAKIISDVNLKGAQDAQEQLINAEQLYRASQNQTLALSERKKAVDELQKQYPDYFKNIKDETILAGNAKDAYYDLRDSILATARARASEQLIEENSKRQLQDIQTINDEQVKYVKAVKDQQAAQLAIDAVNKSGVRNRNANNDALDQTLRTTADLSRANGEVERSLKKINDASTDYNVLQNRNLALQKNIDAQVQKSGVRVLTGGQDSTGKTPKDTSKEDFNLAIKAAKDADEEIQKNENSTYDERIKSAENFKEVTFKIIYDAEVAKTLTAKQAASERSDIEKAYQSDIRKINADAQKEYADLYKKQVEDAKKNREDILKNSLATAEQYTSQLKDDSQASADEQLKILAEQYTKGLILAKDYQERKKEIEGIAKVNQDDIDIAGLQLQYSIRIALGENTDDVEKKLSDAKRKRDKDDADNAIANYERDAAKAAEVAERKKKLQDAIVKDADAAAELLKTIVDAGFQNQLNRVQDEKDALSDRTKAEIDAENRSTDSAQTKADKIAVINAKAQAQQDQLDQKARAIKKKQAEADRLFAIAKIIETTALAVIAALAPPPLGLGPVLGVPFAIAAGALGAVQLATVLATPIPAYEKGTDNAKGGLSLVGEAGKEYVLPPGGDGFFTPDSATLMDIPAGSKVIPHNELFKIMANPFSGRFEKSDRSDRKMIEAINRGNNKLIRAVRQSKGRTNVYVDTLSANAHNTKRNIHFK